MATRIRIYSEGDPPLRPYPWPVSRMLDAGVLGLLRGILIIAVVAALAMVWLWPHGLPAALGGAVAALFAWILLYGHGGFEALRMSAKTQLRRELWLGQHGIWMVGHGGRRRAGWEDVRLVQMDDAWILWIGQERMGTIPGFEVPRARVALHRHGPMHPIVQDRFGRRVPLGMPR